MYYFQEGKLFWPHSYILYMQIVIPSSHVRFNSCTMPFSKACISWIWSNQNWVALTFRFTVLRFSISFASTPLGNLSPPFFTAILLPSHSSCTKRPTQRPPLTTDTSRCLWKGFGIESSCGRIGHALYGDIKGPLSRTFSTDYLPNSG
jgi:hypothetical protein